MSLELREVAIDTPLGRIAGLRGGDGSRRVLALHGWLDNAASFVPLAAHLHGIDLVAIDLPGHGRSAHAPSGVGYTFEQAVHHVLDVADALGWDRFGLLGHSMGAGIASFIAASVPDRVERLACIEALGALPEEAGRTAERMRDAVKAVRALAGKQLRVFPTLDPAIRARMAANQMSEPVARLVVERGVRGVADGFQWASDPRLTVPTFLRPTDAQVVDIVAGIECPVLAVFAEPAQPYLPDATRRRYVAALRHGRAVYVPGTHHLHMEQPQAVAGLLRDFLAGD